jgi:hypothetical protein
MNSGALLSSRLMLALLAGIGTARAAEITPTPDLSVEGTAFVLRQPDGAVLKGAALQGRILQLALGSSGALRNVRLASITPDPDDSEVLRHEFQLQDEAGEWKSACAPNVDNETWGIPVAAEAGEHNPPGVVSITCASGAIAKCIRYGYKPWGRGRHGESLVPYHAACVHMIRADYAGDGTPHTKAGTYVRYHDDAVNWQHVDAPEKEPTWAFEAGWSPDGAVCVARVRWPEFGTVDEILKTSPRLAAIEPSACTEALARSKGALIFNQSRIEPRLGR